MGRACFSHSFSRWDDHERQRTDYHHPGIEPNSGLGENKKPRDAWLCSRRFSLPKVLNFFQQNDSQDEGGQGIAIDVICRALHPKGISERDIRCSEARDWCDVPYFSLKFSSQGGCRSTCKRRPCLLHHRRQSLQIHVSPLTSFQ